MIKFIDDLREDKTKRMVLNESSTDDKEVIFNQNRKCVSFAVTFHLKLKQDELAKTLALPLDMKLTQKLFLDTKFCDVKRPTPRVRMAPSMGCQIGHG